MRSLAVWITAAGANAVLSALEDSDPQHPATHDLVLRMLASAGRAIDAAHLTGVNEGVYDAQIVVAGQAVNARVSDAVALALRCGAPILATEALMQTAGVGAAPSPEGEPAEAGDLSDEQLARFRAFLDSINPEDFHGGDPQP